MGIGKKLRTVREKMGITQEALAEMIGVTSSAVGNYERDVSHPREDILYRLFEALKCEPNELFEGLYESTATERERVHMENYCSLDEAGKNRVDVCTELELERCRRVLPAESDGGEREVLIAARGSGAPHSIKMKKSGSSIFDQPDYRGGGK